MAQNKLPFQIKTHTGIINAPDTELKDILLESLKLLKHDPSLLDRIAADIDLAAKEKKSNTDGGSGLA